MDDLIARLESGEGADRELDAVIMAVVYTLDRRFIGSRWDDTNEPVLDLVWVDPQTDKWVCTAAFEFTASLDRAVAFVERRLRDWSDWSISTEENGARFVARVVPMHRDDAVTGCAKSPARALMAAALRAPSPTPAPKEDQ